MNTIFSVITLESATTHYGVLIRPLINKSKLSTKNNCKCKPNDHKTYS